MRLEYSRNNDEAAPRECAQCGRRLNDMYKEDLCPKCLDINLFSEVKDYIRSNEVKENDVAEHFNIPVSKVRSWIREGRIQYRTADGKTVSGVHCQVCGKSIDFGSVCADCRKVQQLQVVTKQYAMQKPEEMHFLGRIDSKAVDYK